MPCDFPLTTPHAHDEHAALHALTQACGLVDGHLAARSATRAVERVRRAAGLASEAS